MHVTLDQINIHIHYRIFDDLKKKGTGAFPNDEAVSSVGKSETLLRLAIQTILFKLSNGKISLM